MQRLVNWWRAFWPTVLAVKSVGGVIEKVVAVIPIIGLTTSQAWEWSQFLFDYFYPLLIIPVSILVWKAAVAWHKTRGPVITADPVQASLSSKLYTMTVRNTGGGTVKAKVLVTEVTDSLGHVRMDIPANMPVYWCGVHPPDEQMTLEGTAHGVAALFCVSVYNLKPVLSMMSIINGKVVPTCILPADETNHRERRVRVRLVFSALTGEFVEDKELRFSISASETDPLMVRVTAIH